MNLPEWLPPLLQQFPIIGVVFGLVWISVRWVGRRADAEVLRERQRVDAEIARMQQAKDEDKRNHSAEIRRQERRHESEVARLLARIDQLEARLDDGDY